MRARRGRGRFSPLRTQFVRGGRGRGTKRLHGMDSAVYFPWIPLTGPARAPAARIRGTAFPSP